MAYYNGNPNILIHLLQTGYDIRTVQDLLGHKDVSTTMIYTHFLKHRPLGVIKASFWKGRLICVSLPRAIRYRYS